MRLDVETRHDTGVGLPSAFDMKGRRVLVVEIIDRWFGAHHDCCKSDNGAICVLRALKHDSDWQLTAQAKLIQALTASSGNYARVPRKPAARACRLV